MIVRRVLVRVGVGIATLWAVSVIVFVGGSLLPGDPARIALGRDATPAELVAFRHQFGLNRPILERYGDWVTGVLRGDLGLSMPSGEPVGSLIADKVRNSAFLAGVTLVFLVVLSLSLGVLSAVKRDHLFDHVVASTSLWLIATPEFVVGTLLVVIFAIGIGFLPPVSLLNSQQSVFSQLNDFVLPIVTLLAATVAQTIRMVRATMIDVLRSEFVEVARLKGVPERTVLLRHALPNALGPSIQVLAINTAWLVGGIVVVENVFSFPGIGTSLANAVATRDIPTVEAITLLVTGVYICVNITADVLVMALNPRLRAARR